MANALLTCDQGGMRTLKLGMRTLKLGMRTLKLGMKTLKLGMRTLKLGMRTLKLGMRTLTAIGNSFAEIFVSCLQLSWRSLCSLSSLLSIAISIGENRLVSIVCIMMHCGMYASGQY